MIALPAATPVTTPVVELIVATAVLLELHVPPSTVEVNVVVPFEQTVLVPLRVPAVLAAVTVMVLVAVALVQPPAPNTVYVITTVPAETAETNPFVALIVATLVLLDDQVPPKTVELNVVLLFEQIDVVPLNVPALGADVTVTVLVAVDTKPLQPPSPTMV